MRLDRFLAILFSKKMLILLLLAVIALSCLTACEDDSCEQVLEDVLCLYFCGCVSYDTCNDIMWSCDCDSSGEDEEQATCRPNGCVGDSYNSCFNCVWEGGLKDCRPSTVCNSCKGDGEE